MQNDMVMGGRGGFLLRKKPENEGARGKIKVKGKWVELDYVSFWSIMEG